MDWPSVVLVLGLVWGVIFLICFFVFLAVKSKQIESDKFS